MKANEAPEKLYIDFRDRAESTWRCAYTEKTLANDIEYTRTDAFIEKAISWLKENVTNNPECNRIISKKGVITMGELIEDFRKYMKGE